MPHRLRSKIYKKRFFALFAFVISALLVWGGVLFYKHNEKIIRAEKENELRAIADLKSEKISEWIHERGSDAKYYSESTDIVKLFESFVLNSADVEIKNNISKKLKLTKESHSYLDIQLISLKGDVLFSFIDEKLLDVFLLPYHRQCISEKKIVFSDLSLCPQHNEIHYDVLAPLKNDKGEVFAVMITRLNAKDFLFPVIQKWPTPSKTAETILLRKEGEYALYLNDLRQQDSTALKLKLPLTETHLPSVQAVLGFEGIFEGEDYRHVEVFADIRKIPKTNWFMVTKVDKKEMFAELKIVSLLTILFIISTIVITVSGISLLYNYRQKNIYRELFNTERKYFDAKDEFRTALYSIGDAVITTDVNGRVRSMNHVAENLTGWKEAEAFGMFLQEVFKIINEDTGDIVESPVVRVLKEGVVVGLANHTLLISKQGNVSPIADSGAPIRNENGEITGVVLVFRDQTEERMNRKAIEESEVKYRKLFETTNEGVALHEIIFDKDGEAVDYVFVDVNKRFEETLGISKENLIGKYATEVFRTETPPYIELYENVALSGKTETFETYFESLNKHFQISAYSPETGKFATVFQDVTEAILSRKKIEQQYNTLNGINESVKSAIFSVDREYRYTSFNSTHAAIMKKLYDVEIEIGKSLLDFMTAEIDKLRAKMNLDRALDGEAFVVESFSGLEEMTRLYFAVSHSPILNSEGKTEGVAVFATDLTEKKRIEDKLKESENRFTTVYNESPIAITITTVTEGRFIDANNAFFKRFGFERDEVIGKTVYDLNIYYDKKDRNKLMLKLLDSEQVRGDDIKLVKKNGEVRDCIMSLNLVTIENEPHFITAIEDITDRKKTDEALQESEARLNAFMEFVPALILIKDEDLRPIYANDNFKKLFPFEEWHNKTPHDTFDKNLADKMVQRDRTALEKGFVEYEENWTDRYGNTSTYFTQKFKINIKGKNPLLGAIITDVSKRKEAEAALKQSEIKYRYLFMNNPQPMWIYDTETLKYLEVNNVAVQKYGFTREEFLNMTLKDIRPEEDIPKLMDDVKNTEKVYNNAGEWRHRKKNGEIIDVEIISHKIDFDGTEARLVIAHDITERKKAENDLFISESRFATAFKSNPAAMAITSMKVGEFININSSYEKLIGYSYEEIIGKTADEIQVYADGFTREQLIKEIREKGFVKERITNFRTKGNEVITVVLSVEKMVINKDTYLLSTFYDISERQKAEQIKDLQYNIANAVITADNLQNLFESVSNELNKVIDANNFFAALYNEETDMLYSPFEKGIEDNIEFWKAENSLTGKVVKGKKTLLLSKNDIQKLAEDGEIELMGKRAESWLGVPLKLGNKVLGALVIQNYEKKNAFDKNTIEILEIVAHELSIYIDRKKSEEIANRLSKGIEQSPVCIIVTDCDGNIQYTNPKFTEISGYSSEEVIGKNPRILKSGEQDSEFYKNLWNTIKSGKDWQGELHNKKKNGELYWESVIISPIFDEGNLITNYIGIKEDITEKKAMINDLIKAKESAEEMNRLKSSFLANMSHELRTPLNGILGFAEIMMKETQDDDAKMMSEVIYKSGKRLHSTLNQILNLSTLQSNTVKIRDDVFDIRNVLDESFNLYKAEAKKKNLELQLNKPENQVIIKTDKVILLNTLNNIVENALKYTLKGGVKINYNQTKDHIYIDVEDTGIGIEDYNMEIIFDEFRQASEGFSRSFEGTGLGLSICRKYMKLIGGNIRVKSTIKQGSTFSIELPKSIFIDAPEIETKPEVTNSNEHHIQNSSVSKYSEKILYIENDIDNQDLLKTIFKNIVNVEIADNASDGINMTNENEYSVILIDINLGSGMNGKEATKIIRNNPKYKDIPIIAVTAFAMDGDEEEFIESGCSHYISKPFEIDTIQKLIIKLLEDSKSK